VAEGEAQDANGVYAFLTPYFSRTPSFSLVIGNVQLKTKKNASRMLRLRLGAPPAWTFLGSSSSKLRLPLLPLKISSRTRITSSKKRTGFPSKRTMLRGLFDVPFLLTCYRRWLRGRIERARGRRRGRGRGRGRGQGQGQGQGQGRGQILDYYQHRKLGVRTITCSRALCYD
jgi:hypothetical protein